MYDDSDISSSSDMGNVVVVSGMFGNGHTYFANSPVVIDISGLEFPGDSPFKIVRVEVVKADDSNQPAETVGDFRADTGGQSSISFDVSSALRAMWSDEEFDAERTKAQNALRLINKQTATRTMRKYFLRIFTEYLSSDDGGVFTVTQCSVVIDGTEYTDIPGGQCLIGGMTEWERSMIADKADADVSALEHKGLRNGDASTKPTSTPERIGRTSITSWVDVQEGYTKTIFYPSTLRSEIDDPANASSDLRRPDGKVVYTGHVPIVVRDSVPYVDFIFVNRRGAVETCSALTMEGMEINVETTTYALSKGVLFKPSQSLFAISSGGRRSYSMSSGHQTRDWAEWWTQEFLLAKRWWMRCSPEGKPSGTGTIFAPVVVEPAKKQVGIYDKTKQQMPHVDFTVTMALEG